MVDPLYVPDNFRPVGMSNILTPAKAGIWCFRTHTAIFKEKN